MAHVLEARQQEADIQDPDAQHRNCGLHAQQTAGWSLTVQLPARHYQLGSYTTLLYTFLELCTC